jgi:hypothetical protein
MVFRGLIPLQIHILTMMGTKMKTFKEFFIILTSAVTVVAAVACSKFEPAQLNKGEKAATSGKKDTSNSSQTQQQQAAAQLVTKLEVVSKNSNGANDAVKLTVIKGGKIFQIYEGEIDIDASTTNVTTTSFVKPTIGQFNDAMVFHSVLPSGDMTLVVKVYTEYADILGDGAPEALVFSGKVGDSNISLVKDESFLKGLGLEAKTGFSASEIIDQLAEWMQTYGVNGLVSFAAKYEDNDTQSGTLPSGEEPQNNQQDPNLPINI